MKVLVAEDSAVLRTLVEQIITEQGDSVCSATNGEEAIALFQKQRKKIDLIIMDAEMPVKDGIEATCEIRAICGEDWIPIIFLSGHIGDDYIQRALDSGADVYLRKPINAVELTGQIRAMGRIADMKAKLDELNSELRNQANRDGLTKISNRRVFNDRIEYDLKQSYRNKIPLSLALCDIDYFKLYNDTYGHLAGDNCLKKVARTLQRSFQRDTDLSARYGGEEFAVLLPGTPADHALTLLEKMLSNIHILDIPHSASRITDHLTLSIGLVTTNGKNKLTANAFVQLADEALYKAKEKGRNQVVVGQVKEN